MAFLITSLMASTLSEPTSGVGFGRGCEGAIVDGAGREGVAAVNPVGRRPPQNGDAGSAQSVVNPQIWLDIDRVVLLERNVDRR